MQLDLLLIETLNQEPLKFYIYILNHQIRLHLKSHFSRLHFHVHFTSYMNAIYQPLDFNPGEKMPFIQTDYTTIYAIISYFSFIFYRKNQLSCEVRCTRVCILVKI